MSPYLTFSTYSEHQTERETDTYTESKAENPPVKLQSVPRQHAQADLFIGTVAGARTVIDTVAHQLPRQAGHGSGAEEVTVFSQRYECLRTASRRKHSQLRPLHRQVGRFVRQSETDGDLQIVDVFFVQKHFLFFPSGAQNDVVDHRVVRTAVALVWQAVDFQQQIHSVVHWYLPGAEYVVVRTLTICASTRGGDVRRKSQNSLESQFQLFGSTPGFRVEDVTPVHNVFLGQFFVPGRFGV